MAAALSATRHEEWTGGEVTVAQIERELASLRTDAMDMRSSVMTHMAWAPPEWQEAARETLGGLAEQHPSRTLLLFPQASDRNALDADVRLECFTHPELARQVCSETIELRLHGDRARAPASVVLPLVLPDLPVFLRWRGQPEFGGDAFEQLVDVVDRLIVDSREWSDAPASYGRLTEYFDRVAVSDIVWARTLRWRRAIAALWPDVADVRELEVAGPAPEASMIAGWLRSRLGRDIALRLEPREHIDRLALDDREITAREERASPSDLLSRELDRFSRDSVYEAAAARA